MELTLVGNFIISFTIQDTQNGVTVIEEDGDDDAWKNEGLIKTKIMQEAFSWTDKGILNFLNEIHQS